MSNASVIYCYNSMKSSISLTPFLPVRWWNRFRLDYWPHEIFAYMGTVMYFQIRGLRDNLDHPTGFILEKQYRAIFHEPSILRQMKISWLWWNSSVPFCNQYFRPSAVVLAKAQSPSITTISSMLNLMSSLIVEKIRSYEASSAFDPTDGWNPGAMRTPSDVYMDNRSGIERDASTAP